MLEQIINNDVMILTKHNKSQEFDKMTSLQSYYILDPIKNVGLARKLLDHY